MNNKSIIYFGVALPVEIEEEVARFDLLPHVASHKFSWTVVRSLCSNFDKIYNISSCEIRNYPAGGKLAFRSNFFSRNGIDGFLVGFINLLLFKHLSRTLTLLLIAPVLIIWRRVNFMLVHGSHTPFMLIAILSKLLFRVRIVILLTDQHGLAVISDGWAGRFFRSLDTWLMRFLLHRFDAYICLSPAFISKFGLANVFVVPGILNEDFKASVAVNKRIVETKEFFDIVFAGGVTEGNGIDRLIRAFGRVNNLSVRLLIYGAGPLVEDVKSAARNDFRIIYGGVLHGDELTQALLAASLLINPRPVGDEYAQTSFPSKLIEYMATGVPTLTTRLLGIPDDVSDCFYLIDGDSEENIAQALINVMNIPLSQRSSKGCLAAEKVSRLYSEQSFGQRVYELLRSGYCGKGDQR